MPSFEREGNRFRGRLEVQGLDAVATPEGLRVARLQERVHEGIASEMGPVVLGTNTDGAGVRQAKLLQQSRESTRVDESSEPLKRGKTRREPCSKRGSEVGHREGPLIATGDDHHAVNRHLLRNPESVVEVGVSPHSAGAARCHLE